MDWMPALTTTSVFALILYLSRALLINRLSKAVQHEFDAKVETLKSELRSREAELGTLRDSVMNGRLHRHGIVETRKLQAVDKLWEATLTLGALKPQSDMMKVFEFDGAMAAIKKDPTVSQFFEEVGRMIPELEKIQHEGEQQRPFITASAWAQFAAYRAVLTYSAMQFEVMRNGVTLIELADGSEVMKLVRLAAPELESYLEGIGRQGFPHLVDVLQQKTLSELIKMVDGADIDQTELARSAEIVQAANSLVFSVSGSKK